MKQNSKRIFAATAITAAVTLALSPALWAADNVKAGSDSGQVRVTDFSGRPPFKRGFASTQEVADLARFEEVTSSPKQQRTRFGPPGKATSRR